MESDIVTPESRNAEIERIHTEAVGSVLYGAMQIFAAITRELNSEIRKNGYCSSTIAVSSENQDAATGLLESLKQSLADDPPVSVINAVEKHDDFDILDEDETARVAGMVLKTFRDMMGAFGGNDV